MLLSKRSRVDKVNTEVVTLTYGTIVASLCRDLTLPSSSAKTDYAAVNAELDRMVGELTVILDSVATVQQAPIGDVEPISHPMPLVNVTRPDEVRPSLTPEQALSGAPLAEEQRFSVPRILSED